MEGGLVRDFIETMGNNDNVLKYDGKYYFFDGFNYNKDSGIYSFIVYEVIDENCSEIIGTQFQYECKLAQECIDKFLEAKIWNGKTFYEVEKEMLWVD